jgi:predicted anti-sigma-YlaC factor YlaD
LNKIDCDALLEVLSEYIDSDAREEMCRAIESHLSNCKDCSFKVDTVKKTIVLYQKGTSSSIEMPMRATAELNAALARAYGTT